MFDLKPTVRLIQHKMDALSTVLGILFVIILVVIIVVVYFFISGALGKINNLFSTPGAQSPQLNGACFNSDAGFQACIAPGGAIRNGDLAKQVISRSRELGLNDAQTSCVLGFYACQSYSPANVPLCKTKFANRSSESIKSTCGISTIPTVGVPSL